MVMIFQILSEVIFIVMLVFAGIALYQKIFKKIIIDKAVWITLALLILFGVIAQISDYKDNSVIENKVSFKEDSSGAVTEQKELTIMRLLLKKKVAISEILGKPINKIPSERDGSTIIEGYDYAKNISILYINKLSCVVNIRFQNEYEDYKDILRKVGLPDNIEPTRKFVGTESLESQKALCRVEWDFAINGIKYLMIWGESTGGQEKYDAIQVMVNDGMPPYRNYKPTE